MSMTALPPSIADVGANMSELTWEDEQDINEYLAWKIDNDWATKGKSIMPQTMVKETTTYTLEELEALSWNVHKKALQKVREWNWESWEPQFYTDDIKSFIGEEYPLFDLTERTLEWSTNPTWIEAEGDIDIYAYMRHFGLHRKYVSLWYALNNLTSEKYIGVKFGNGISIDVHELRLDIDYIDDLEYQSPRYVKLQAQVTAVADHMENYIDGMSSKLLSNLSAEEDYQGSDEYAKETIEAYELRFTEDGDIYRG